MKIDKKKIAWGVGVSIALGVLWQVFKPAPAEAADIELNGSINYRLGNDEDANGTAVMKAEDNGSSVGTVTYTHLRANETREDRGWRGMR